jgi:diguanylate cyclase (GGDEF)-like protein
MAIGRGVQGEPSALPWSHTSGRWLAAMVTAQQQIARSGPSVADVADVLAAQITQLARCDALVCVLEGTHLRVVATTGSSTADVLDQRFDIEGSLAGLALQVDEIVVSGPPVRPLGAVGADLGARSAVAVALRHGRHRVGALVALSREPQAFSQNDHDVLTLLAQAGGAAMAVATASADLAGERLRTSATSSLTGTGLWRWDIGDDALVWSPEMYEITGLDPLATTPSTNLWESMLHPDDRHHWTPESYALGGPQGSTQSLRLRRPGGEWRELVAWSRAVVDGGVVTEVYGATVDVTRQRLAEREVARLAARDTLTGLANRAVLDDLTRRAIAGLPEPSGQGELPDLGDLQPVTALLLLDLDRFKLVNDTLGHTVGDALLVEVAARLSRALDLVAASDFSPTIARLGGDEFVILVPWLAGVGAALDVAQLVLAEVRRPVEVDGVTAGLVCTGSIGVAVATECTTSAGDLFREADLAMYRAKDAGRDRVALFDSHLRAEAERRVSAEGRLRTAIRRGRLLAVYQPIVALDDERVVGAEALVRLVDERGRTVQPEAFIDVAEDTGLIVEVDRWMLTEGIALLTRWGRTDPGLTVSVNVSARTLSQPGFDDEVLGLLAAHGVPEGALRLELTESSMLPGGSAAQDAMRRLAAAGVKTGVDDFGTGYSALSYLADLPVGFIKVDRSFVARLDGSELPSAVVRSVIDLAHAHGYQVTAEGVETRQQATLLREMGCDHAQGWLFGRPAVAELQLGDRVGD